MWTENPKRKGKTNITATFDTLQFSVSSYERLFGSY